MKSEKFPHTDSSTECTAKLFRRAPVWSEILPVVFEEASLAYIKLI